jgi:hypothetical protein
MRGNHNGLAATRAAAEPVDKQPVENAGGENGDHERYPQQLQHVVLFHMPSVYVSSL